MFSSWRALEWFTVNCVFEIQMDIVMWLPRSRFYDYIKIAIDNYRWFQNDGNICFQTASRLHMHSTCASKRKCWKEAFLLIVVSSFFSKNAFEYWLDNKTTCSSFRRALHKCPHFHEASRNTFCSRGEGGGEWVVGWEEKSNRVLMQSGTRSFSMGNWAGDVRTLDRQEPLLPTKPLKFHWTNTDLCRNLIQSFLEVSFTIGNTEVFFAWPHPSAHQSWKHSLLLIAE